MKKWKIACLLFLIISISAVTGAYWLEWLRAGELGRLFTQALAHYTGSSIFMYEKPSISIKTGGIRFGTAKFCIVGSQRNFLITIPEGEADIDLIALFLGNFMVREIRIDKPVIQTVDENPFENPWYYIVGADEKGTPKINIQRLIIQKGNFSWQRGASSSSLEQINLSASFTNQQEADLRGDFALFTEHGPKIQGNLAFRTKLHYYSPNLTFRHTSVSFTPIIWPLPKLAGPLRLVFDGALNLDTLLLRMASCQLNWPGATLGLKGAAILNKGSISAEFFLESTPKTGHNNTGEVSIQGFMERQTDALHLEEMAIQMGKDSGSAELSLDMTGHNKTPRITGSIHFGKIILNDLPGLLTVFSDGIQSGPWPETNLHISGGRFIWNNFEGKDLKLRLIGRNGNYTFENLSFMYANGKITGEMKFSLQGKFWKISAKGKELNLAKFKVPICAREKATGNGEFMLSAKGNNLLNMLLDLEGEMKIRIEKFSCKASDNFIGLFSEDARKLLLPRMKFGLITGTLELNGGKAGIITPLNAINDYMRAEGEINFKIMPLSLDAKILAKTNSGEIGLDFTWPKNYFLGRTRN